MASNRSAATDPRDPAGLAPVQGVGGRNPLADRRPAQPLRAVGPPRAGRLGTDAAERFPPTRDPQERGRGGVPARRNVDLLQARGAGRRPLRTTTGIAGAAPRGARVLEGGRGGAPQAPCPGALPVPRTCRTRAWVDG